MTEKRRVEFAFGERNLDSIERLRAQGYDIPEHLPMTDLPADLEVATLINLSRWPHECPLCGEDDFLDFCVPFYEGPRLDLDIGDLVPGLGPDAVVGGMPCCDWCWAYHQRDRV